MLSAFLWAEAGLAPAGALAFLLAQAKEAEQPARAALSVEISVFQASSPYQSLGSSYQSHKEAIRFLTPCVHACDIQAMLRRLCRRTQTHL